MDLGDGDRISSTEPIGEVAPDFEITLAQRSSPAAPNPVGEHNGHTDQSEDQADALLRIFNTNAESHFDAAFRGKAPPEEKLETTIPLILLNRKGIDQASAISPTTNSNQSLDSHGGQHTESTTETLPCRLIASNRGNFSLSSQNIALDEDFNLVAECDTVDGSSKLSILSLTSCLSNHDGIFKWVETGVAQGNFHRTSRGVKLEKDDHSILVAELRDCEGNWVIARVCLNDRIANQNGSLELTPAPTEYLDGVQENITLPITPSMFSRWDPESAWIATAVAMRAQRRGEVCRREEIISPVLEFLQSRLGALSSSDALMPTDVHRLETFVMIHMENYHIDRDIQHLHLWRQCCEEIRSKDLDIPERSFLNIMMTGARALPRVLRATVSRMWSEAQNSGNLTTINEAIKVIEEAQEFTPEDHPEWPSIVLKNSELHFQRYKIESDEDDLYLADVILDTFLTNGSVPDDLKGSFLITLAKYRAVADQVAGTTDHREEIILLCNEAIPFLDRYNPPEGKLARFRVSSAIDSKSTDLSPEDNTNHATLKQKIQAYEELVAGISTRAITPTASTAIEMLCDYSDTLRELYLKTKDVSLMDKAMLHASQAAAVYEGHHASSRLGRQYLAQVFACVGYNQAYRAFATETSDHINTAISTLRSSIQGFGENNVEMAHLLHCLGRCLFTRFMRSTASMGDNVVINEDFEDAISYGREAHRMQPNNISFAVALAEMLYLRWDAGEDDKDFEEALEVSSRLRVSLHQDHPRRSLFTFFEAQAHFRKFCRRHSREDYDRGAVLVLEGLKETLLNETSSAELLARTARWMWASVVTLVEEFHLLPPARDYQWVIEMCHRVLMDDSAPCHARADADTTMIQWSLATKRWDDAVEYAEDAIDANAKQLSRAWSRRDQEWAVGRLRGISSLTSHAAIEWGEGHSLNEDGAMMALKFTEASRGLLAKILLTLKNDVSYLDDKFPAYGARYKDLREKIMSHDFVSMGRETVLGMDSGVAIGGKDNATERHNADLELEELTKEIRGLPGFHKFQVELPFDEVLPLTKRLRIVQFVFSNDRTDAILVDQNGIRSIPLPLFQSADIKQRVKTMFLDQGKLAKYKLSEIRQTNEDLKECLRWLWRVAVQPALEALGLTAPKPSGQRLPRIWWSANGVASQFPFHAAGEGTDTTSNTFDHVVSSYVSSLATLVSVRASRPPQRQLDSHHMTVISMPTTPGSNKSRLDTAVEEAQIKSTTPDLSTTFLTNPTQQEASVAISTSTIIHFICHGESKPNDPSHSALLLGRSSATEPDLLRVQDLILPTASKNAQIAYLAACSTAQNANERFADESIHMANAFQLSGFPHVIGTMWVARDKPSAFQAGYFYHELFENLQHKEEGYWDDEHDVVAYAVHAATTSMRRRKEKVFSEPLSWAPFVHFGA